MALNGPDKPEWIVKSSALWARKFNIPMNFPPEGFPKVSTTPVQQALCAVDVECPEKMPDVLDVIFDPFWVQQKPVFDIPVFTRTFEEVLGLSWHARFCRL